MRSFRTWICSLVGLLALVCACTAMAASAVVDARLTVVSIRTDGNVETAVPATAAKPDDVLEYRASYRNQGAAPAQSLMPTIPIPVGTEYLPAGTSPKPTYASLDMVAFARIPLRRQQVGANGVAKEVDVPASEYRALRWSVGALGPGEEVSVRARVRVASPSTPPPR